MSIGYKNTVVGLYYSNLFWMHLVVGTVTEERS